MVAALAALVAGCGGGGGQGGDESVNLAIVAELSGSAAEVGEEWKEGAEAAIADINDAGGILDHKVGSFSVDTQSDAAKSASAIRNALSKDPFAVIGPVVSSSIVVDAKLTRKAKVPEVVGGVADEITQQGNDYVLRAGPPSGAESQVIAKFLAENVGAHKVAIVYRNDQRGQSASETLGKYLKQGGVSVDAVSVAPDQTNYAGTVGRVVTANPDAVYLSAIPTQDAQIISELKRSALGKDVVLTGDQDALSPTVSKLTDKGSDGMRGVINYSADAPGFAKLAKKFAGKHDGQQPTANFYKAYIFTWMIKYAAEDVGKLDQDALMDYIHDRTFCVDKYPHLLQSFYIKKNGDPDGPEYVTKVVDGKQQVVGTVKPLEEGKFSSCKPA
ncbi:MAG: ABC transporter substrate-binding protein [Streptosporangiales bacterium]